MNTTKCFFCSADIPNGTPHYSMWGGDLISCEQCFPLARQTICNPKDEANNGKEKRDGNESTDITKTTGGNEDTSGD